MAAEKLTPLFLTEHSPVGWYAGWRLTAEAEKHISPIGTLFMVSTPVHWRSNAPDRPEVAQVYPEYVVGYWTGTEFYVGIASTSELPEPATVPSDV